MESMLGVDYDSKEDEYDALNDETFGAAAEQDGSDDCGLGWEENHDLLAAQLEETIRRENNASHIEEIVNTSISHLGLNDEPLVAATSPQAKHRPQEIVNNAAISNEIVFANGHAQHLLGTPAVLPNVPQKVDDFKAQVIPLPSNQLGSDSCFASGNLMVTSNDQLQHNPLFSARATGPGSSSIPPGFVHAPAPRWPLAANSSPTVVLPHVQPRAEHLMSRVTPTALTPVGSLDIHQPSLTVRSALTNRGVSSVSGSCSPHLLQSPPGTFHSRVPSGLGTVSAGQLEQLMLQQASARRPEAPVGGAVPHPDDMIPAQPVRPIKTESVHDGSHKNLHVSVQHSNGMLLPRPISALSPAPPILHPAERQHMIFDNSHRSAGPVISFLGNSPGYPALLQQPSERLSRFVDFQGPLTCDYSHSFPHRWLQPPTYHFQNHHQIPTRVSASHVPPYYRANHSKAIDAPTHVAPYYIADHRGSHAYSHHVPFLQRSESGFRAMAPAHERADWANNVNASREHFSRKYSSKDVKTFGYDAVHEYHCQQRKEASSAQAYPSGTCRQSDDPYAEMMTEKEKEFIIRVQMMSLNATQLQQEHEQQSPAQERYIQDYYYLEYIKRHRKGRTVLSPASGRIESRVLTQRLFECTRRRDDSASDSTTDGFPAQHQQLRRLQPREPQQFENSLGKLHTVTAHAPKKILDMAGSRTLDDGDGRTVPANTDLLLFRKVLLDTERSFTLLLLLEDPDEVTPRIEKVTAADLLVKRLKTALGSTLPDTTAEGTIMTSGVSTGLLSLRKGRLLVMRSLCALWRLGLEYRSPCLYILNTIISNLEPIVLAKQKTVGVDSIFIDKFQIISDIISNCTVNELSQLQTSFKRQTTSANSAGGCAVLSSDLGKLLTQALSMDKSQSEAPYEITTNEKTKDCKLPAAPALCIKKDVVANRESELVTKQYQTEDTLAASTFDPSKL